MNCVEKFENIYRKSPESFSFCPYRICPLGAHVDHQNGKVTGLALDKGISIAYAPKYNGVVELVSLQFDKRAQFHVRGVPELKQNDWADYLRGATVYLSQRYQLTTGISGVIEGSLPIGGLSSSAAVTIAYLSALCKVNGITLEPLEMVTIAKDAENKYVGVSCGKLDQNCEINCRKDHLLYLDTLDDTFEQIPTPPSMPSYDIAIFFSGLERNLAGSKFNMRVDECKSAAYAMKAYAGMEYGKFNDTCLRDVPFDVFEKYGDRLPDNWRKRAAHYYSEQERVGKGVDAWRRGDLKAFGRLCFESGASSIFTWETGSPELKAIYEIMTRTDGIYGGRFSGAGFKGCCMALIDPSFRESVISSVTDEYLKAFPQMEGKFASFICHSADGISL